ncbi:MAG: IclR family transcriptional regulator [Synergistaceae bacterium]|nr:IclR family transcriptional regulator [Synergistaceae bacterium]
MSVKDLEKNLAPTHINQSSDKLLNLLEIMTEQPEPLRLQDLARICGMNASTALRFLNALQRRKYVEQEASTGRYYLTFKLCALAQNVNSFFDIRSVARPFLRNVTQIFSESCNLAVESDMTVIYIEVEKGPNKMLMSTQRIGNVAPLYCTGVGKLFLTDYSPTALDRLIALKGLTKYTEYTITDPEELKAELERIKKTGYAFDNEECEEGARCIAAPVRDYTGRIKAAISVSGPVVRMTDKHIFSHLPMLLDAAEQISFRMGWKRTPPPETPEQQKA